jgi:O-succinylhomoserine sulfhydrylase
MASSALKIAEFLSAHPKIEAVSYPFLKTDKNYELARKQMTAGGTTVSFKIKGDKEDAFATMNSLVVIDISNNLGDSKSLITHPASTTHRRLTPEIREQMGITPNLVRLSVGLENVVDLVSDLKQALG